MATLAAVNETLQATNDNVITGDSMIVQAVDRLNNTMSGMVKMMQLQKLKLLEALREKGPAQAAPAGGDAGPAKPDSNLGMILAGIAAFTIGFLSGLADSFRKIFALTKFDKVLLNVSFDSHPDRLAYIRGNANGKKMWQNIQKISEMSWSGELTLELAQVIMSYNIFDFWELGQLVDETPWLSTNHTELVVEPFHHCPGYMKQEWKEKAIDIAKQNNSYDKNKHVFEDMLSKETNLEHMKKLKYLTGLQDFSRGKHLKDYHPICYDMLEDIQ